MSGFLSQFSITFGRQLSGVNRGPAEEFKRPTLPFTNHKLQFLQPEKENTTLFLRVLYRQRMQSSQHRAWAHGTGFIKSS